MTLPHYQTLLLPALRHIASGATAVEDLRDHVAAELGLTAEDRAVPMKGGIGSLYNNRVAWALVDLQRAGLIEKLATGRYEVTAAGTTLLVENRDQLDLDALRRLPGYVAYKEAKRRRSRRGPAAEANEGIEHRDGEALTPAEQMAALHDDVSAALEDELLARLQAIAPLTFQSLILKLLLAMGYGGGREEMVGEVRRGSDGGIDGTINEDPLGLDVVYMQAKRYAARNGVGRPEIQAFAGSLEGKGANKGLFFTTSFFTRDAIAFADRIAKRIILIDGQRLAQLMIRHNVGVRVEETYEIKTIDENTFIE